MFLNKFLNTQKKSKGLEIIYRNAVYIFIFLYNKICWFPMKKCWCQRTRIYRNEHNQFVPGNLANFAGGTIIFFMFAALIISSLAAVPDGTVAHSLFSRNFFTPILLQQIYECLAHWDIWAFLGNCSREFCETFFSIQCVIVRSSCPGVFYVPEACNFIKKETLAQVSSCEFCEISKNIFLHRTPLVTTSK